MLKTRLTLDLYRLIRLLEQVSDERNSKTIIFTGTKRTADEITRFLRQDGFAALAIHGDKKQQERDWVMSEFKSGKAPILIATDVAARGLGKLSWLVRSLVFARVHSYVGCFANNFEITMIFDEGEYRRLFFVAF